MRTYPERVGRENTSPAYTYVLLCRNKNKNCFGADIVLTSLTFALYLTSSYILILWKHIRS